MFINWKNNNVHAFGSVDGKTIKWLRPGWNEFPSELFKQYENDAEVKRFISEGKLEILAEKVGTGKTKKTIGLDDKPIDLKELTEAKSIEIIKNTFNRELLQRWIDEENRSKVKRALEEQIKPLMPDKKAG